MDKTLSHENNKFVTLIYHKPKFSVFTNFEIFTPDIYKTEFN